MRRIAGLALLVFLAVLPLLGQNDLVLNRDRDRVEFPFEYINNFIVVNVTFNNLLPLKFIFDTGAENTILTRREISDLFSVNYQRRITIYGADLATEMFAYLATGVDLNIGGQIEARNQTILVMEEDYFSFEQVAGFTVHGILGADFLRRFVVHIDFRHRRIILQDPSTFTGPPSDDYHLLPSEFDRYKPYLLLPAEVRENSDPYPLKLLMDTGASLSLLIYPNTDTTLQLPNTLLPTAIGMGLGGILYGYVGRLASVEVADYKLVNVLTNFQEINFAPGMDTMLLNNRTGIVGNQVLDRFNLIIDYVRNQVFVKPDRDWRRRFEYDRSGMSVTASGPNLNHFTVTYVIPGSPAELAGVEEGDRIKAFNRIPHVFLSLSSITNNLQKRVGKRIRLRLERDEEIIVTRFRLQELI